MNKVLKRGISVYMILMKNKLATALMMLVSGTLMTIAALNGRGNDTKTIPIIMTAAGIVFALWAFYRMGYIKANYDRLEDKMQRSIEWRVLVWQAAEALIYMVITGVGIYLLLNQGLMDLILNLVTGGLMILNGVLGVVNLHKRRAERNWRFYVRLVLTVFELVGGIFFVASANSVEVGGLKMMGILTAVAGVIEVAAVASAETLKNTVKDGKDIVRTIKTGKAE